MDDCLFCKIAKGEIPSKKVYEDRDVIAFLDINPANAGHTLVVPKKHSEDIMSADDDDIAKAIKVAKKIASKLKDKMSAAGVNVLQNNGKQAGQIVSHIHFHVIPRYPGDVVVINYQRKDMTDAEMEDVKKKLSEEDAPKPSDFDLDF